MLVGHAEQIRELREAMAGPRFHHAWLLVGQKGLGKAALAKAVATRLLAEAAGKALPDGSFELPEDHPSAQLIAARSHPDFKLVEREVWDKGSNRDKLIPYADRKGDEEPARSIRVIQIRWLEPAIRLAPSLSSKRVILIDAADDLETSAANALLKMLEEPPAGTHFFLISHAPDKLLPTIRSRCRTLRFGRLDDAEMKLVLRRAIEDADPQEIDALVAIGEGVPGKALRFAGLDIGGMDTALEDIGTGGDPDNGLRHTLATQLSAKSAMPRYQAFLARAPGWIATQARHRQGRALSHALEQWEAARSLADAAIPQSLDPYMAVYALASHVAALAPTREGAKA